jgi:anti-sigma factor RsiW
LDPLRDGECGHDIEALLHKRADDRLSHDDEAAALERRLASCARCRERAALLAWAADSLRSDQKAAPAGLTDAVMRRLAGRQPARLPSRRLGLTAWHWLPAAAAVLAVGVGVLVLRHHAVQAPPASGRVEVELQLPGEQARSVAVAGDFNGWDAASMRRGADGVWRIRLSLSPGRYQYAFLVDDAGWVADPRAATVVDSGYGGADSVLDLSL